MQKNANKPGYKKTKVGWIPKDWECVTLGQVFKKRTACGKRGIPVFSVTQDRGMVPRSSLERRTGNDVTADKSLLVEPGDLAYNMMRMWQGAVAVCHERCVISPAYVVCRPDVARVDPNFMLAYFKSREGMHRLCDYSYGITSDRLRLYFEDFSLVPAPLPSRPEQKAIAEVLECWDKAINALDIKIGKKRQVTKGMLQKLLSGGIRVKGYSTRWKSTRLGKVTFPRKDKIDPRGNGSPVFCVELEHIEAETGRLIGFTSATNSSSLKTHFRNGDVLFGKLRPYLRKCWLADRQGVCSTEIWALVPDIRQITSSFLCQIVKTDSFIGATSQTSGTHMPRADWQAVKDYVLLLPSLDEQRAIAEILSAADDEIDALERKLALLKEQKRFLLHNLVPGAIRLSQFCRKGGRHD